MLSVCDFSCDFVIWYVIFLVISREVHEKTSVNCPSVLAKSSLLLRMLHRTVEGYFKYNGRTTSIPDSLESKIFLQGKAQGMTQKSQLQNGPPSRPKCEQVAT